VAAKCGKEILAPFGYSGTCDTNLFNLWLKNELSPQLKRRQILIMDNASIHKSEETEMLIRKAKCKLVFLPPYSPDLNPIEHVWSHKKRKIRAIAPNFKTLEDAINYAFL
jgi:transposase